MLISLRSSRLSKSMKEVQEIFSHLATMKVVRVKAQTRRDQPENNKVLLVQRSRYSLLLNLQRPNLRLSKEMEVSVASFVSVFRRNKKGSSRRPSSKIGTMYPNSREMRELENFGSRSAASLTSYAYRLDCKSWPRRTSRK